MALNHFTLKIGGPAGFGIKSTGLMFAKACFRGGLRVFDFVEYPSLIRGGHNTYSVTTSTEPIYTVDEGVDILIALDELTINEHHTELTRDAGILYDTDTVSFDAKLCANPHVYCFPVPMLKIAMDAGGTKQMINMAALGATVAIADYDINVLLSLIHQQFTKKGDAVVRMNQTIAQNAYTYAKEKFPPSFPHKIEKIASAGRRLYLTGNEAIALGAIAGGVKSYIAYPMTPSSTILHSMVALEREYDLLVKQPEDELAAINMAIGSAQAGARTMVGTSGGGFSLMAEALGLAALTETPLVIAEVQRPGPSTGLPTWTEQGDMQFVMHASQGDFPRCVLVPGDTEEAFYLTAHAQSLAEKYQMQIIILSDKHLSESGYTTPYFDLKKVSIDRGKLVSDAELSRNKNFKRYAITPDGISPRSIPGQKGGLFLANSDEHDEYGYSDETAENRIAQVDKRERKVILLAKELPRAKMYGPKNAKRTLISTGSTKNAILEALEILKQTGDASTNFLQLYSLTPFVDEKTLHALLKDESKVTVIIENNKKGQLGNIIREATGFSSDYSLLKYDGRQFFPSEIVRALKKMQ